MSSEKHIVILGGGISGLACVWFLNQYFPDANITIIEKTDRLGGWIRTETHNGFLFDKGPRSCRTIGNGVETLKLIQDLQLESEVLIGEKAAHKRFLYFRKKLREIPYNFSSLMTNPWIWRPLSSLLVECFRTKSAKEDESIHDFISRRLSSKFAEVLIDPLTTGIYAGDIHELSIKSCFPILHQWEKEKGFLLKGAFSSKKQEHLNAFHGKMQQSGLFTFKKGMETLVKALAANIKADIKLSAHVKSLQFRPDKVLIELSNQDSILADRVVSTIPSYALAPFVSDLDPILGNLLQSIPHASVATVNIGFHRSVWNKKGFGYLIPSSEKEAILGMVWDSHAFSSQNRVSDETRFTVMMGGAKGLSTEHYSKYPWKECALEALSRHLGISERPDEVVCQFAMNAIPQYIVGHSKKVNEIEQRVNKLSHRFKVLGNSFYGVSVNDCIANAKVRMQYML